MFPVFDSQWLPDGRAQMWSVTITAGSPAGQHCQVDFQMPLHRVLSPVSADLISQLYKAGKAGITVLQMFPSCSPDDKASLKLNELLKVTQQIRK